MTSFWTPERDDFLRYLREDLGLSIESCSARFGGAIKRDSISVRCRKLGIQRPSNFQPKPPDGSFWTPEREAALAAEFETSKPHSRIADVLGTTKNSVTSKCQRLNLRRSPGRPKDSAGIFRRSVPQIRLMGVPCAVQRLTGTSAADPVPGQIKLTDLKDCMCHWPIGDPMEESFHFCGRRKAFGVPYCEHHGAIAYPSATPKRRGGR
jgi:GcrA cell cycle regulator